MSTPATTTTTTATGPKSKKPEPIIPTEEVKKEDTKGDKRGHGKSNKGPNAVPAKTDRQNQSGQKKTSSNSKRAEGAYIKKAAVEGEIPAASETPAEGEETKKVSKPKYERPERISTYNWDKFSVTLETPIPVKPVGKEVLVEPKKEDLEKLINSISAKIEAAKTKKKALVTAILNKDKTVVVAANESADPLHVQLKDLNELVKVYRPLNEEAQAKLKVKQDVVDGIKKREEELQGKMRVNRTGDQIIAELEELEYQQQNAKLTSQQEKKIVQQIEELKLSLPFAAPLQKLRQERRELEDSMRTLRDESSKSYKKLKDALTKIKGIREELDRLKKLKEETNSTSHPEIDTLNENFVIELEALKKERNDARDKHHQNFRAYQDQQELFRYIDFVKRQHEFLRKREQQKKRDEDRKKREVEEIALEEEKKKSKYVVYVESADLLIEYLEKLSGKGDKKDYLEAGEVEKPSETKQNIRPEDLDKLLQKEKLTVLVSKKDRQDQVSFGSGPAGKKNKQAQQQQQKPQQATKAAEKPAIDTGFMHSYEIMQQFEKLVVSAPTYKNEIEKTIALLNEKKQYYIDLPNKEATEPATTAEGEQKQEKKGKKQQNKIEFDESAFPTIDN